MIFSSRQDEKAKLKVNYPKLMINKERTIIILALNEDCENYIMMK